MARGGDVRERQRDCKSSGQASTAERLHFEGRTCDFATTCLMVLTVRAHSLARTILSAHLLVHSLLAEHLGK